MHHLTQKCILLINMNRCSPFDCTEVAPAVMSSYRVHWPLEDGDACNTASHMRVCVGTHSQQLTKEFLRAQTNPQRFWTTHGLIVSTRTHTHVVSRVDTSTLTGFIYQYICSARCALLNLFPSPPPRALLPKKTAHACLNRHIIEPVSLVGVSLNTTQTQRLPMCYCDPKATTDENNSSEAFLHTVLGFLWPLPSQPGNNGEASQITLLDPLLLDRSNDVAATPIEHFFYLRLRRLELRNRLAASLSSFPRLRNPQRMGSSTVRCALVV